LARRTAPRLMATWWGIREMDSTLMALALQTARATVNSVARA